MTRALPGTLEDQVKVNLSQRYYPDSDGFPLNTYNFESIDELTEYLQVEFEPDPLRKIYKDPGDGKRLTAYGGRQVGEIRYLEGDEEQWAAPLYKVDVVTFGHNQALALEVWKKMCQLWPQLPEDVREDLVSEEIRLQDLLDAFEDLLETEALQLNLNV